jgi:phosphoribosyl 1,2-cyclic phosphodiesterase
MDLSLDILASGSAGNCGLLQVEGCNFLIDAGISARRTAAFLRERGLDWGALDGIFLTHEHGDHAGGLKGILGHKDIPVYASQGTARSLQPRLNRQARWKVFTAGQVFRVNTLKVETALIPHDASEPVAFLFTHGEDTLFSRQSRLAWILDLGEIPEPVADLARRALTLVIESNHDEELLEQDTHRPWKIKERIRGLKGHLSNRSVSNFLAAHTTSPWEKIIFAHLSRDCNNRAALEKEFRPRLEASLLEKIHFFDPLSARIEPIIPSPEKGLNRAAS